MNKLIVGLGNPGNEYANTRHNVAWLALEHFTFSSDLRWLEKFKGLYANHNFQGEKLFLLKPQTFMNLSGESVAPLVKFFKIEIENIIVLQDEIDLPFGQIMFKNGGGLAGHNGLKSISQCLGSQNFHRLRIGIGRPTRGSVSSHVLSNFSTDEQISLDKYFNEITKAVEIYLKSGFDRAANKFNKKNLVEV